MRFNALLFILAIGLSWATPLHTQSATEPKVVSGTILLNDKKAPDFKKILADLPGNWYIPTDSASVTDKTAVFSIPGATIMLAYLDYPVNPEELQMAAAISWLWKTAEKEVTSHKAQLVISVVGEPAKTLELYRVFTRVAAGALANSTNAPGIYMNSQYLLLSTGYYIESARNMGRVGNALYCWVYFGILNGTEGKSSGYTFGMTEFGQKELELVNAPMSVQDAHSLVFATAEIGIQSAPFTSGQVVDIGEGQKIKVTIGNAQLIRDGSQTSQLELIKK